MNMTEHKPSGYCFRCQQPFRITALYRITHVCLRCRNQLIDAWARMLHGSK